ncbi:unnamed protein product [Ambrosiozyma monospora]|uniref:Unnamed protein product n=1 Tax=Ambrosiozyma monospora TaxID=43982 RepID=A0A9W6Z4R2_AMBMO|nr:unnamed protein product [Ambrosiozyma monospora]
MKTEDYENLFGRIICLESDRGVRLYSSTHVILKVYSALTAMTTYYDCFGNIKFHDGEYAPLSSDEYIEFMMTKYKSEISVYKRIEEYNKIHKDDIFKIIDNTPKLLKHGYCCIEMTNGALLEGMFLALEYLPFKGQYRTRMNPVDMREKLESIGIHARHPDFLPKILSADENDETFIYDFGKAVPGFSSCLLKEPETETGLLQIN